MRDLGFLQNYGYNILPLMETVQEIREHYTDVLMQHCVHEFREIFNEDNYHPLQVSQCKNYGLQV